MSDQHLCCPPSIRSFTVLHANSFETLQMFLSWSEDMHVVWILSSDYFLSLFPKVELSNFLGVFTFKVNR